MSLAGKSVLITGGARRVGRALVMAVARAGADVFLHYHQSETEAKAIRDEVTGLGRRAVLLESVL